MAVILSIFVAACLLFIAFLMTRGKHTIIPFFSRREQPWDGLDAGMILFAFFLPLLIQTVLYLSGAISLKPDQAADEAIVSLETEPENKPDEKLSELHPIAQVMLQAKGRNILSLVLIITFLSAVISAPISEEFIFRLLIQGYFEKFEHRLRKHHIKIPVRYIGFFPILITSLVFAWLHVRGDSESVPSVERLLTGLGITIIFNTVITVSGIVFLLVRNASLKDLGFDFSHFFYDFSLGFGTFLVIFLPIMSLKVLLSSFLPDGIADPITLIFFSMFLGILYFRTHRLIAPIVLHASLNFTSFALLMIQVLHN